MLKPANLRPTLILDRLVTLVGIPLALALITWVASSVAALNISVAELSTEIRTSIVFRLNHLEVMEADLEQRLRVLEGRGPEVHK